MGNIYYILLRKVYNTNIKALEEFHDYQNINVLCILTSQLSDQFNKNF